MAPFTEGDVPRQCDHPECRAWGMKRVGHTRLATYMEKEVCEAHVQWARDELSAVLRAASEAR